MPLRTLFSALRRSLLLSLSLAAFALPACRGEERGAAVSHVEIIAASPSEDLPASVQRELGRAKADGRELLVYVGAPWCEPCKRFHDAAAAGELDTVFPKLRLLEFNLDRDKERLEQAGYRSRMIPLFARPGADGTGSGQQIEGSIKGEGAVAEITPRLRGLLAR